MLSERHAAMLDFERSWWTNDDPRDQVVRARFQCSPEEYDAEIAVVLENPDAAVRHGLMASLQLLLKKVYKHEQ
jgi:hypothetical protein